MEVFFGEERSLESVHFSDANNLFYNEISDELEIKRRLMKLGNVRIFSRSSKVMEYYIKKRVRNRRKVVKVIFYNFFHIYINVGKME